MLCGGHQFKVAKLGMQDTLEGKEREGKRREGKGEEGRKGEGRREGKVSCISMLNLYICSCVFL